MNNITDYNEIWVFLSHSNGDYEKVRVIRNLLEENGFRPIMFYLNCISDDDELDELIRREIDSRDRFILCDSENASKSKWVQSEVDYILSKNRPYTRIDVNCPIEKMKTIINSFRQSCRIYISHSLYEKETADILRIKLKEKKYHVSDNSMSITRYKSFVYLEDKKQHDFSLLRDVYEGIIIMFVSEYSFIEEVIFVFKCISEENLKERLIMLIHKTEIRYYLYDMAMMLVDKGFNSVIYEDQLDDQHIDAVLKIVDEKSMKLARKSRGEMTV